MECGACGRRAPLHRAPAAWRRCLDVAGGDTISIASLVDRRVMPSARMCSWKVMFTGFFESVGEVAEVSPMVAGYPSYQSDIARRPAPRREHCGERRLPDCRGADAGIILGRNRTRNRQSHEPWRIEIRIARDLERAMAADGRFGGHMVLGHVDGTGTISPRAGSRFLVGHGQLSCRLAPYLIHRDRLRSTASA